MIFYKIEKIATASSYENNECNLMGSTGLLVQCFLGLTVLLTLIVKRFRENPKRPWKIWAMDGSKQCVSLFTQHMCNLFLSILISSEVNNDDECVWYFITYLFDCFVGVLLCYLLLRGFEMILMKKHLEKIKSGNYYRSINIINYETVVDDDGSKIEIPKETIEYIQINYLIWAIQLLIWIIVVIISKTILYFIEIEFAYYLQIFSEYSLSWTEGNSTLKLIFVMVLVPSVMNVFQVWIQDNILKKDEFSEDIDINLDEETFLKEVYIFQLNKHDKSAFENTKSEKKFIDSSHKNDGNETKDSAL